MPERNWAERFDTWIRRTPAFIYLVLLAVVMASGITIWQGVIRAWDYYEDTFRWREEEYSKIALLRSGISIAKVEEILGSPLFVMKSQDGSLTESTFEGRDYWVQAVHDLDGTVQLMAVTSCSSDFKPRIESPAGTVVLNDSSFDSLGDVPNTLRYFISGATANSFFFDEYGGGNPGLYKTYFVGINDACPAVRNYVLDMLARGVSPIDTLNFPDGIKYWKVTSDVAEFRSQSIVNTYAEMGPGSGPMTVSDVLDSFQIGVDRILTRTVHPDKPRGGYPEGYSECISSAVQEQEDMGEYFRACAEAFSE